MTALARFLVASAAACLAASSSSASASQGAPCRQPSYECAAEHVKRGDYDAAIGALSVVLEQAPRRVNALHLLGVALTGAGRIDEANRQYRAALHVDPAFYPAARNLGINEFNSGKMAAARLRFEDVLRVVPADQIAHLHLAEIHYAEQRLDVALSHYRKSGGLVSEHGPWALHFGISLVGGGDLKGALGVFAKLPTDDAVSRFEAAMALGRAGAYADAAHYFDSARAGYPDPYRAAYNHVLMLTRAKDFERAVRTAEDLLQAGTRTAELYHLASLAYLDLGDIRRAIDALRESARLDPAREETYVDLSLICLNHDDYDLGLEVIDLGLKHRPDSAALYLHRGVLQTMRGELGDAEAAFETARRLDPHSPHPQSALAMVWIETGRSSEAARSLRDSHRRVDDAVLSYTFALALIRSGIDPAAPDADEAIDALRHSIAVQPSFAPSHAELGRLLLRRGRIDDAVTALEAAIAADASSTTALYNLAQAYRQKGDTPRARALLARLTKLNADAAGEQDVKQLIFGVVKDRK